MEREVKRGRGVSLRGWQLRLAKTFKGLRVNWRNSLNVREFSLVLPVKQIHWLIECRELRSRETENFV